MDDSWADFVVGVSHSYAFSQSTIWSSVLDYGTGGSEGSMHFDTGITWIFDNSWSVRLYAALDDVDYQEGNAGDNDYYLYDVEETRAGFSFLYNF